MTNVAVMNKGRIISDGNSGINPFSFVFISQKSFSPLPKE
jgi:hypothetical protein